MRLLAGESMVLPPIRRHWVVLAGRLFWPAAIAAALLVPVLALSGSLSGESRVVLTLAALSIPAIAAFIAWLTWWSASIVVTDQRVILERGIFDRSSVVIPLNRVQDVSTRQSLLGRLFDYGRVEIDTAGVAPTEVFFPVPHPEQLRDQVFVLAERFTPPRL